MDACMQSQNDFGGSPVWGKDMEIDDNVNTNGLNGGSIDPEIPAERKWANGEFIANGKFLNGKQAKTVKCMANKKNKDGGPVPDGAADEAALTVTSKDDSAPLRS